ncbi:MAG: S8 family serine peptidase [Spirulinaceae cyanobacterium]
MSRILLAGYFLLSTSASEIILTSPTKAQIVTEDELYYNFFDQKISLNLRSDALAVAFKPQRSLVGATRGASRGEISGQRKQENSNLPLHLQLQQDLQEGVLAPNSPEDVLEDADVEAEDLGGVTRSGVGAAQNNSPLNLEVKSLGENYALVSFSAAATETSKAVRRNIEEKDYVETTLPVLTRSEKTSLEKEVIILPNEITINFASGLSESEKQTILAENNLQIIRPLRFSSNRYLVSSTIASGTEVLQVANQLNQVPNIESANPNFIQTLTSQYVKEEPDFSKANRDKKNKLLAMHWHLNSTSLTSCLKKRPNNLEGLEGYLDKCLQSMGVQENVNSPRIDIRATEAWQQSNRGEGVTVAVIDSLIQWEHPDLINNIHKVSNVSDRLPGEVQGWDFVENDPDTGVSPAELQIISTQFRQAFTLSDGELRQQHSQLFTEIAGQYPKYKEAQIANTARFRIRNQVAAEFHGTMVSGVVAAQPQEEAGVTGVAPQAQILPIRVIGMNGSFSNAAYLEALAYAGARKVDIINLSLGSQMPSQGEVELISELLEADPQLVIVAAAGNQNQGNIIFPAGVPGVVAVGATNLNGYRASYSNYGENENLAQTITVVAPGGDNTAPRNLGRILTTGGTWLNAFWTGIDNPGNWGPNFDTRGKYRWSLGTSFATPAVAGVIALMKGEDVSQSLNREQIVEILQQTSSYQGLSLREEEIALYKADLMANQESAKQYFFGSGLVNAEAAVQRVKD